MCGVSRFLHPWMQHLISKRRKSRYSSPSRQRRPDIPFTCRPIQSGVSKNAAAVIFIVFFSILRFVYFGFPPITAGSQLVPRLNANGLNENSVTECHSVPLTMLIYTILPKSPRIRPHFAIRNCYLFLILFKWPISIGSRMARMLFPKCALK